MSGYIKSLYGVGYINSGSKQITMIWKPTLTLTVKPVKIESDLKKTENTNYLF